MLVSRRPTTLLLTAVAALALALAGCGDDDEDTGSGTTTTTAEVATGDEENVVTIDMKDFAFDVTGSITAGTSTVVMKNTGQEMHMTSFGLLKEGRTLADVQAALQSEDEAAFGSVFEDEEEVNSPGGFLNPGQTQETTTPFLEAGNYALMCFLPSAGDGAPHFAKGMIGTLEVAAGDAEVTPEPDAEYTVEDGKIDGPTSLPAGETTIQVDTAGTIAHEFFVARKKDASTSYEDIDEAFSVFESDTPPPANYVDALPAVIVGSTFDIKAGSTIFLTVNLEPGQYLIGCALEPDEEEGDAGKAHEGELAEVTVT